MSKNEPKTYTACIVHLATSREDEGWCDVIALVNLTTLNHKLETRMVIDRALEIPKEDRVHYWVKDLQGNKMQTGTDGEPFALVGLQTFFDAVKEDCAKMAVGEQLLHRRLGVALYLIHGILENPLFESHLKDGTIAVLIF